MNSKNLKYIFIILYGLLIATGPMCMAYLTAPSEIGYTVLWILIPNMLLVYLMVYLATKVLYTRFLRRDRYMAFAIWVWVLAYITDLAAFNIDYLFRTVTHLPHVIANPFSPWVYLYIISSSGLFVLTIEGFFLWRFYEDNRRQNAWEKEYKKEIEEKSELFRNRIRMPEIKRQLNDIILTLSIDASEANRKIRSLSDFLRHRLYDDPTPEQRVKPLLPDKQVWNGKTSPVIDFITLKKYRLQRHLLLWLVLGVICFGLMFDLADKPVFDMYHLTYAICVFLILLTLIYLNVFLIFPFFLKKERHRLYIYILLGLMITIFILLNLITFSQGEIVNRYGVEMPWFIVPFGIAGNLMTFLLLMGGSASIMLLKRNLVGKWHLSRLEAERAEIEFENLQHQINPHTIFNLLNNVGFLSYEDPQEAITTLRCLEGFLDYILADSTKTETTIREEINFINNYFTLEKSSGKDLDTKVECSAPLLSVQMPPLLLIPFVENAVKHSVTVKSNRFIEIIFAKEGEALIFKCRNTFIAQPHSSHPVASGGKFGGLGINNTRRRLELLYGNNFTLSTATTDDIFSVTLKLPLSK